MGSLWGNPSPAAAPARAGRSNSIAHARRFAYETAPGRRRDRPGRPGARHQPLQPAVAGAAVPVAEGRVRRQLHRARFPVDGLLRGLVRGAGGLGLRGRPLRRRARSCSSASACSGVAAFGFAASPSYWMLAGCAVVAGVGNGVFHPVDYTLFNRKVSADAAGPCLQRARHHRQPGLGAGAGLLVPLAIAFSWRVALVGAALLVFAAAAGAVAGGVRHSM